MKKLLALLLATVMVLSVAALPALAEEPAAEQTLYLYQDEGNESVQFPWYNLRLPQILMYRSLVTSNAAETEWYPDMAEYTVSEDGLTYTFVLQDGLKWSDGEPITADDIVWNIETALKAAQVASAYTTCFGYIQGAAEYADGSAESISGIAVDGNTITISLTVPYAFFLRTWPTSPSCPSTAWKTSTRSSFISAISGRPPSPAATTSSVRWSSAATIRSSPTKTTPAPLRRSPR